jgi:hypothetical protein
MILLTIDDVRKYRQLGKQKNLDSFFGRVREMQDNQLFDLLGAAMHYDFFNFLQNGFTPYVATAFVKLSNTEITIEAADVTNLIDYAIRINEDIFGIVTGAIFDGTDTVLTISGNSLSTEITQIVPNTITSLAYSVDTEYINLLNGTTYIYNSVTYRYNGLRPYLTWLFLASFALSDNVKHGDVGNFNIVGDNIQQPSVSQLKMLKSEYQQNAAREANNITDFLNQNSTDYDLWNFTPQENPLNFDMFII